MQGDIAIHTSNITKVYRVYSRPEHRLLQMVTLGRVRRFAEYAALRGISLDIHRGETVGIVGRNGCGKSTLLQIICGTLQPTSGRVAINGRVAALLELGSGFNPEFTGRENVYMNGAILGMSRAEVDARFAWIADFAGIGDFMDQPVKTYSSGMTVRLAFAVATSMEPEILVVDEALAVGDEAFQRKCFARIEVIKEAGCTILFVSHNAQTIVQLCDRAILLDGGEKILEGKPKAVVAQYQRLVNSSGAASAGIRGEIVAMGTTGALDALDQAGGGRCAEAPQVAEDEPEEIFNSGLISQSAVELEERGARIANIRCLTLNGRQVNVLRMGRRYAVEYDVVFSEAATQVGFGMHIRTTGGFGLAGVQTIHAPSQRVSVQKGDRATVRFEISCLMVPATYFITCGIFGSIAEELVIMHRVVDGLAIAVAPEKDIIQTGFIDLSPEVSITLQS